MITIMENISTVRTIPGYETTEEAGEEIPEFGITSVQEIWFQGTADREEVILNLSIKELQLKILLKLKIRVL